MESKLKFPNKAHWRGRKHKPETIAKMRGRKLSLETKQKLSTAKMGNKANLGKTLSQETKNKISAAHKGRQTPWQLGEKHWNWKGGLSPERKIIMGRQEYKLWRKTVFERDNYTCIWCGKRGVELNADHIKPFALYPELRFVIDNGRTLCVPCHATTDTYKGRLRKRI